MAKSFQWIEFYMEFADKLLIFKNNRASLLKKIQGKLQVEFEHS